VICLRAGEVVRVSCVKYTIALVCLLGKASGAARGQTSCPSAVLTVAYRERSYNNRGKDLIAGFPVLSSGKRGGGKSG